MGHQKDVVWSSRLEVCGLMSDLVGADVQTTRHGTSTRLAGVCIRRCMMYRFRCGVLAVAGKSRRLEKLESAGDSIDQFGRATGISVGGERSDVRSDPEDGL